MHLHPGFYGDHLRRRRRPDPAHAEICDRVEDDRRVRRRAQLEALCIGLADVRDEGEIDHERLLDRAVDEDRVSPIRPKGCGDHEDAHEPDHDSPVLEDDGVLLHECQLFDRFRCPSRPEGVQASQHGCHPGEHEERAEGEIEESLHLQTV